MVEVEEAQARILAALPIAAGETVPLPEAVGRILLRQIVAAISLPPFDNSAMDGYALRAMDTFAATSASPVALECIGSVPAGTVFADELKAGRCIRIFTGSPLPRGADAVVMQEDTQVDGTRVALSEPVKPWENVRLAGEDVKRGETVLPPGKRLAAAQLALLGALGVEKVEVGVSPAVAIVGTGSELLEPGSTLGPGQIYESNRHALAAGVREAGGTARVLPLVRDSLEATVSALRTAFETADMVVTSGGVSVGEHDLVKVAFESMGGTMEFWRVAMKPGKPFLFGRWKNKFLFGLPGNPVSAFLTFLLLVRPALLRLQGAADCFLPEQPGVLGEALHNGGGRRHYVRVRTDERGEVWSAGTQASHTLGSLARADGLVSIPPETRLPRGTTVKVSRLP